MADLSLFDDDDEEEWVRKGGAQADDPKLAKRKSTSSFTNSSPQNTTDVMAVQRILRTHATCRAYVLGSAQVDAPNSKAEVQRVIANISQRVQTHSQQPLSEGVAVDDGETIEALMCFPRSKAGALHVVDINSYDIVEVHNVSNLIFFVQGEDQNSTCIGVTIQHVKLTVDAIERESSDTSQLSAASSLCVDTTEDTKKEQEKEKEVFMCHVFKLPNPERTDFALELFRLTMGEKNKVNSDGEHLYSFDAALSISESSTDTTPAQYSQSKNTFKLRPSDNERLVTVVLTQTSKQNMIFEQGYGLLIGECKKKDTSYDATEMLSCERISQSSMQIVGKWNPPQHVKAETEIPVSFAIAVDATLSKVNEPLRLELKFMIKVSKQQDQRFYSFKKGHSYNRSFSMKLQKTEKPQQLALEFLREEKNLERQSYLNRLKHLAGRTNQIDETEENLEIDEHDIQLEHNITLSGTGKVGKEMTEAILDLWADVLPKWDTVPQSKIRSLVRKGIPDVLRHQVWGRLVTFRTIGIADNDLINAFPSLVSKESETEKVIKWDLTRTFPANPFFAEAGGEGQIRLYRVCKAYSVYDDEIGYCQGLSFIGAVLLLHMPDEEAFCLFIKIMFDYGVREMFKSGFADLQLKFYQLERLMEDFIPDLHEHFKALGIECHMFASQWFLTLYSSKFPLVVAYHVIDVLLSEGMLVLYQIALGLLKHARADLLQLEFEDILGYFRLTIPRRYQTVEQASMLISSSLKNKVTEKRLKKYEIEYLEIKTAEAEAQDPLVRLEEENTQMRTTLLRLETENETLASDLGVSKMDSQDKINALDISLSQANREITRLHALVENMTTEHQEDITRLEHEAKQIKDMYRTMMEESAAERTKSKKATKQAKTELTRITSDFERERKELEKLASTGQARAALEEEDLDKVELQAQVHDRELKFASALGQLAEKDMMLESKEQQLQALRTELEMTKKGKWFKGFKG